MVNNEIGIAEIVEWLLGSEPVVRIPDNAIQTELKNIVKVVSKFYKQHCNSEVRRGDWVVQLTNAGIRSSFQHGHGRAKINAFAAVPEMIAFGRVIEVNANWKNRGYDSYVLAAPIQIGSIEYIGEVIINHHKDGKRTFYLHEVEEKTKLHDVFTASYDTSTSAGASRLRITQVLEKVKPP